MQPLEKIPREATLSGTLNGRYIYAYLIQGDYIAAIPEMSIRFL